MATINKGILGGFSGTVGTVVGANWRGKDIIRSKPAAGRREPSDKQLLQQAKFKLVSSFLQALKPIQNRFFGESQGSKSRTNLAMSYTLKEAVVYENETWSIIYSKVLITKGDLSGLMSPTVNVQDSTTLAFSWVDNSNQARATAQDYVSVVCYNAETQQFFIFENAALRSDIGCVLSLPDYVQGKALEIWMYCSSSKEDLASTSIYLGTKVFS